ncbi:hypothetical protein [Sporosarcina sp. G11-34]|uniref:hypothetical protein n=1 Tax=Sporosarcina sp. G11-34 TaxID=2849605 RepID=UPI0022A93875|nr:hypothetical protein [Sporosarcina sp. G11-34]MCZ2258074.1 hypothetical protein [Sporosarcina sp. G11-34]
MNNLFFIILLLTFPVMLYFCIRGLISFIKKNKPHGKKMLKFLGATFGVTVVSFIVFAATIGPVEKVEAKPANAKSKIEDVIVPEKETEPEITEEEKAEVAKKEEVKEEEKAALELKAKEAEEKVAAELKAKEEALMAESEKKKAEEKAATKVKAKEETLKTEVPKKENGRDLTLTKTVKSIVKEDFNKVATSKVLVNDNMESDTENNFIVLPHLKWDVKNGAKSTREMLEMYSDHLAAKLADESDVKEITIFWEVPYHLDGENIAKYMYERSGNGMAKVDVWLAPLIRE